MKIRHLLTAALLAIPIVTNGAGTRARLYNVSARAQVRTNDSVLIGGFIINGTVPKQVMLRAIGPSLATNGVGFPGRLLDPTLTLFHEGTSQPLATNDNWKDTQQAAIQATALQPGSDFDSAILITLDPGNYTTVLRGKNNTTGIALVEVFDLSDTADGGDLRNISARGVVEPGDNVLIGGFIIQQVGPPPNDLRVVVRAIGPSLAQYGIANPIIDPTLTIFDANGMQVDSNDNWQDSNAVNITQTALAPSDPREAAIARTLLTGNYTAIVRGKTQATGTGLVEVYEAPASVTQ